MNILALVQASLPEDVDISPAANSAVGARLADMMADEKRGNTQL